MLRQRLVSGGLAVLLALLLGSLGAGFAAVSARAGDDNSMQTDVATGILVNYWDLRDSRKSFFQVTNTTAQAVSVHIQVWNASAEGCPEYDFQDTFTPHDTHLYDLSALDRNDGVPLAPPDLSGGHGIVAVTVTNPVDPNNDIFGIDALTGNFRIVAEGFEYRTNSAGWITGDSSFWADNEEGPKQFNFNTIDGSTLADIVLVNLEGPEDLDFSGNEPARVEIENEEWNVVKVDENENLISCPNVFATCGEPGVPNTIDFGVNQLIVNSKGGPSLCLGTDATGQIIINPTFDDDDEDDLVVGFIGLNNGTDTGSMDVWFNGPDVVCDLFGDNDRC